MSSSLIHIIGRHDSIDIVKDDDGVVWVRSLEYRAAVSLDLEWDDRCKLVELLGGAMRTPSGGMP